MIAGIAFLSLALFLTPALFGNPPQTQVWNRLIVGLLPPDVGKLKTNSMLANSADPDQGERHATSSDPKVVLDAGAQLPWCALGLELRCRGRGIKTYRQADLHRLHRSVLANCRAMENGVMPRPEVVDRLKKFVTVQLWTDEVPIRTLSHDQQIELAGAHADFLQKFLKNLSNPLYVMMTPDGEILGQKGGYVEPDAFVSFIDSGLSRFEERKKTSVAKTDAPRGGANGAASSSFLSRESR